MDEDTTNTALEITTPTDADGNSLTITVTAVPSGGTLATADGTTVTTSLSLTISQLTGLVFTPDANLNDDTTTFGTFTYTVSDGSLTGSSTVTISVTPVNDAATVNADTASTNEDTAVSIDVLSNDSDIDGDTFTVTAATVSNGTVVINSNNTLNYTPNSNFNGAGTITYSASDGTTTTAGTVSVTVNSVNDAPELIGVMEFAVDENTTAVADMTDTDVEGDTLTYSITGGDDQTLFAINASSGALSIKIAPDYENSLGSLIKIIFTQLKSQSMMATVVVPVKRM